MQFQSNPIEKFLKLQISYGQFSEIVNKANFRKQVNKFVLSFNVDILKCYFKVFTEIIGANLQCHHECHCN